jgi:hypothetical protein
MAAADELELEDLLHLRELPGNTGWHYVVLDGGREIGPLALVPGRWIWELRDRASAYAPSREAALQALAQAWIEAKVRRRSLGGVFHERP